MSMDRCADCGEQVDTDEDVECYDDDGRCVCIVCREIEAMARRYYEDESDNQPPPA